MFKWKLLDTQDDSFNVFNAYCYQLWVVAIWSFLRNNKFLKSCSEER